MLFLLFVKLVRRHCIAYQVKVRHMNWGYPHRGETALCRPQWGRTSKHKLQDVIDRKGTDR